MDVLLVNVVDGSVVPVVEAEGGWLQADGSLLDTSVGDWRPVEAVCADLRNASEILSAQSVRDLEAKIRDGVVSVNVVFGEEGGSASQRFLAAIALNFLLGDENVLPANYRMFEFELRPAGEMVTTRVSAEVLAPGGRSAHVLRGELERICGLWASGERVAAEAEWRAYLGVQERLVAARAAAG